MTTKQVSNKQAIVAELQETSTENVAATLEILDAYSISQPSTEDTDQLFVQLLPILEEELTAKKLESTVVPCYPKISLLQLTWSQTRLFSPWFIVCSGLFLSLGLSLTTILNGDTLRFLANASPILGILTILYQFRAHYNHMNELEAACPYSPGQLVAARLWVILIYDCLLCLAASVIITPASYHIWQVITHWLAPLLLTLSIALLTSLRLGIMSGCLLSTVLWVFNLLLTKDGNSIPAMLFPHTQAIYLDVSGTLLSILVLTFSLRSMSQQQKNISDI